MDKLWLCVVFEAVLEPRRKALAGVQQPFKGDGPRGGAVVEKDGNRDAGVEAHQVGPRRVHARVGSLRPARAVFQASDVQALVRRQHRKLDAVLGQQFERFRVRRRLRQPHPLGQRAVVALVVGDAPANLRDAVAAVGQRQDDVVVNLRHGRTVALEALPAAPFAVQDHAIGALRVLHQPAQQRRPEVETDARVIVHNARDLVLAVHDARRPIGGIALRADALVPVVVGRGRILRLHCLQPGILPRRLVKVTVNADKSFTCGHENSSLPLASC